MIECQPLAPEGEPGPAWVAIETKQYSNTDNGSPFRAIETESEPGGLVDGAMG
jgi:hypothetical protein